MAQRGGGKVVREAVSPAIGGRLRQHTKLTVARVRRTIRNNRLSGKAAERNTK